MLTTLRVKNLALVERVVAEFRPGLNVITGETGTGKSILIGALSLVLGERADKRLIRAGAEACGAEAVFQLPDADAINALLVDAGLEACEGGQLIVRRILKAEGANQIHVNDQPATLQLLKQLGELLVDMHGPYDHQSLLNPAFQLDLLDAAGHIWEARETYEVAYRRWRGLEDRIAQLLNETSDPASEIDRLQFVIKDIEALAPVEGEEEAVEDEQRLLGQAQRVQELCHGAADALAEGETAAFNAVVAAQRAVEELARLAPEAGAWLEQLRAINAQLQEVNGGLHNLAEKTEADPRRLDWLDERLAAYQRLRKKYAPTVPEVLALLARSKERLLDLQNRDEQLERLRKESAVALTDVRERGATLSAQRHHAGKKLGAVVTQELRALGFAGGVFAVALQPAEPQPAGMDSSEFGFAPNIGEPMHPLRAIASSGEIARVMLAIKCVLAQHDRIPVLIFDEVDANIGGETGNAVGQKLAEVAGNHQVICITHLPQVAAHGQTHLAVTKSVREGRTFTEVKQLDERGRVNEIARMLGGRDLTNVTLAHARALLEKA
jgi:DNA repair protein RecN (Recombination protein N)